MNKTIKEDYNLDGFSILLFLLVSFCFKDIYKFVIPFLIGISLIQFYRFFTGKVSKEYIFYSFFYLLVYATVFYKSVQTITLIQLLLFLVLLYFREKPNKKLKFINAEVLILIFFILIFLNLGFFEPRFKGLEKYLYLFFLPLLFLLLKKLSFELDKYKLMRVFIFSILISSLQLTVLNFINSNLSLNTNTFFSNYLGLTHVYFGMFLGVAGCFLLILYKEGKFYINASIDILIFCFFLLLLIHIGARTSLLSLALILAIILFQKTPLPLIQKCLLILVLGCASLIISYNTIPRAKNDLAYIQKVYESVKNNDKEDLVHNSWRNMYQRFLVTDYTLNKIKEEPILGIGMQNVKKTISDKIIADGYLYFEPVNTHNQYLQILVGMGIFAVLYFLIMLSVFYKQQSYSLYFITFFLIIMLTESLLVRVKGISLFFLFSLIFSFKEGKING